MNICKSSQERVIAVSISESPDMLTLGLSDEHLRDAMIGIARHLLRTGAQLVYGGDLRQHGFSELLFELVTRYRAVGKDIEEHIGVTNYLAWPVHIQMPIESIESFAATLSGSARLICLDIEGKPMNLEELRMRQQVRPSEEDWCRGLTAMRHHMLSKTNARIVLGGRVDGYKGTMPGIAEEALLSLQAKQPLFVIGGYGGCARDIANSIGLLEERTFKHCEWRGQEAFYEYTPTDLNNGLTFKDNSTLANTPHIDQAIILILRGLLKIGVSCSSKSKKKF